MVGWLEEADGSGRNEDGRAEDGHQSATGTRGGAQRGAKSEKQPEKKHFRL